MIAKHVLLAASATRFDLFEEIVTLVVYQDKCWKIFHFDLPDRFHAQFGIFHTFDALDVVLGQNCSRAADTSQIETTIFLASIRHLLATVTFRLHDHATAMTLEQTDIRVHTAGSRRTHRTASHTSRSLGRTGIIDRMILDILR